MPSVTYWQSQTNCNIYFEFIKLLRNRRSCIFCIADTESQLFIRSNKIGECQQGTFSVLVNWFSVVQMVLYKKTHAVYQNWKVSSYMLNWLHSLQYVLRKKLLTTVFFIRIITTIILAVTSPMIWNTVVVFALEFMRPTSFFICN